MATNRSRSLLVDVAQGIADEIAGATFAGVKLKPVRSYADWDEKLEDHCNELLCDVVPVIHRDSVLENRGSISYVCEVDVGIRYRPKAWKIVAGRIAPGEIDKLILLVEAMAEFFIDAGNGRKLAYVQNAAWIETKIRQTFVRKHLREFGQFTSITRLTYDVPTA